MTKTRLLFTGGVAFGAGCLAVMLWARPAREEGKAEEAPPKAAPSRIAAVTVYPDSALVTREVDVPAGQGNLELVVTPLPHTVVSSSLYSEGSDGVRILTTRFRSRPVKEDTREEVRKLPDEQRKLQTIGQN